MIASTIPLGQERTQRKNGLDDKGDAHALTLPVIAASALRPPKRVPLAPVPTAAAPAASA